MKKAVILAFVEDNLVKQTNHRLFEYTKAAIKSGAILVCADSGGEVALAWGLVPDILIGDMDSISPEKLTLICALPSVSVFTYPIEKNETDLELALLKALEVGAEEISIIGGVGGRLDHTFGNIFLLADMRLESAGAKVHLITESEDIFVVRAANSPLLVVGNPGDLISIFPFFGDAEGITTSGLYYPLKNEKMPFGPSRGISNYLVEDRSEISLEKGMLLVMHSYHTK